MSIQLDQSHKSQSSEGRRGHPPPDLIYSAKQAAELLGVSAKTSANWRCSGSSGLKFVKIGSRVGYLSVEIEEFLDCRAFGSTSEYPARSRS
ncbi:helix-turn-helix domain-containing protein [Mesorhizobium sp. M1365]|uniref:helix-turn-helix domain-containing protein n=1 Tax=Mesorhizobium sp. M1365 TaxID=2957090 RepID=UPI00333CB3FA